MLSRVFSTIDARRSSPICSSRKATRSLNSLKAHQGSRQACLDMGTTTCTAFPEEPQIPTKKAPLSGVARKFDCTDTWPGDVAKETASIDGWRCRGEEEGT